MSAGDGGRLAVTAHSPSPASPRHTVSHCGIRIGRMALAPSRPSWRNLGRLTVPGCPTGRLTSLLLIALLLIASLLFLFLFLFFPSDPFLLENLLILSIQLWQITALTGCILRRCGISIHASISLYIGVTAFWIVTWLWWRRSCVSLLLLFVHTVCTLKGV